MKKLIYLSLVFALAFSSCKRIDFGDINVDPTQPSSADAGTLMRSAFSLYSQAGGRYYYSNASLYAQYQSQTQYTQEQRYNQANAYWGNYYQSVLLPLKQAHEIETDPFNGDNRNIRAISELFSVLVWKRVTDSFGDVPYTEAFQGLDNLTPAYTPQKDIYLDLLVRAKAARDLIDTSSSAYKPNSSEDILYKGDMTKWAKFANSLIMSISLQLTNTTEKATAQAAFIEALGNSYGSMETNDDNLVFVPDPYGGLTNPISKSRPDDFCISKEMTDAMKGGVPADSWGPGVTDFKNPTSNTHADARLQTYLDPNNGIDGLPYGYSSYDDDGMAKMNNRLDGAGANFVLFNAAYSWLNRAEASLSSVFNTGEDTNNMLQSGIETSFEQNGLSVADGTAQALLRITDAGTAPHGMAQIIGEEKWFALFPDGYAAWAEQRRTGYPNLRPAPQSVNGGVIPHRFIYPSNAQNVNPAGWQQGVNGLVPAEDANTSQIWWEQ